MKKLLIEILVLIFGGILFIILGIVGIIYTFFKHILKFDYSISRQLIPIIRGITLAIDGFANSAAGELLNDCLKVPDKDAIRYGKWYQTISAITGLRLIIYLKDNKFRKTIDKILGSKHCETAITEQDLFYYKSKNK